MDYQARSKEMLEQEALVSLLKETLRSPLFQILVGFTTIEYLQNVQLNGKPVMPAIAGTAAESALVASVGLQQLAPLVPYIASAGQSLASELPKLLPALAAVGALK